jgi:hypothetical protein
MMMMMIKKLKQFLGLVKAHALGLYPMKDSFYLWTDERPLPGLNKPL